MILGEQRSANGIAAFLVMWAGQLLSLTGSSITRFALTLWAWEVSGQATVLATVALFSFGPSILIGPLAGALVDRWPRKAVLIGADVAAALVTAFLLVLHLSDALAIWHLYLAGVLQGIAEAFQSPAYTASITLMVPERHYERASGLTSFARSARDIGGPILAGMLLPLTGLRTVFLIDLATFGAAVIALAAIHVPQPDSPDDVGRPSLWHDVGEGFRYIAARPGLLGLLGIFFLRNLTLPFAWVVFVPMVLARTGNNTTLAGTLEAMIGVGGVLGALLISMWGGPRRRMHGVIGGMALRSAMGSLVIGLAAGPVGWGIGAFFSAFWAPLLSTSTNALWQATVDPAIQGRVFAVRRLVAQVSLPVSLLMVGPAADVIFEPAMQPGGALSDILGGVIAPGPGAGMALMHVIVGVVGVGIALVAWFMPAIRDVEEILITSQREVSQQTGND